MHPFIACPPLMYCPGPADDALFLWDPNGTALSTRRPGPGAGEGKRYALSGEGTALVARFRDQFAPWDFAAATVPPCSGAPCTLLRLALRSPAQAARSDVSDVRPLPSALA